MDGVAGALVFDGRVALVGDGECQAAAGIGEVEGEFVGGDGEFRRGDGGQCDGNLALAFVVELAVFGVETERSVGFGGVGVFAGESVEVGGLGGGLAGNADDGKKQEQQG